MKLDLTDNKISDPAQPNPFSVSSYISIVKIIKGDL